MEYLRAFLCGGALCAAGQVLIDKTTLTPGRILTGYVTAGVLLTALGVYGPLADWAGCGATVGKLVVGAHPQQGGVGSASITLPEGVTVGAVVAVNAVGDVYHPVTGECIACASLEDGTRVRAEGLLCGQSPAPQQLRIPAPGSNTTIGVVAVDCALTKEQANRLADVSHDGLARAIRPVPTQMDGDTMFALATGRVGSDVNFVKLCAAAAEVTARAIANAILFSLDA